MMAATGRLPDLREVIEARSIDSLSIAPDGHRVAYRVIARSVETDKVMAQWHLAAIEGGESQPLGRPAEPFFVPAFDLVEDGLSAWDPAGSGLLVLQGGAKGRQIHRLGTEGRDEPVTDDPADILSFAIDRRGDRIDYVTRADRASIIAAQAAEERDGVHIDRTVFPEGLRLTRNFRDGERWTTIRRAGPPLGADHGIDAFAGGTRAKSIALPQPSFPVSDTIIGRREALVPSRAADLGRRLEAIDGRFSIELGAGAVDRLLKRPLTVIARLRDGRVRRCAAFFCKGNEVALRQVLIDDRRDEVVIAHEADYSARTGLYAWNPLTNKTRVIRAPAGSLDGGSAFTNAGCARLEGSLICVESAPDVAPRLVRIDLATGLSRILADPNASLRNRDFGRPRYLAWRDVKDRPWNGILLEPAGPLQRRPLVIVTYRCRGFLRGGISNLAPEYPLVAAGFAVLCANQNNDVAIETTPEGHKPPAGGAKATLDGYAAIIRRLDDEGRVDRSRVGISGHSFSANAVGYAISHSRLFAAAVMGAGTTLDPASYNVTAPTADSWRKDYLDLLGLPRPSNDSGRLWDAVSPALNARAIETPLLLQPPENEWLFAMQLFTYMQDAGKTVDMYVYPDEGHNVGRHPIHQLRRGQRSIDWFRLWLSAPSPALTDDPPDIRRWKRLRTDAAASSPSMPPHPPVP